MSADRGLAPRLVEALHDARSAEDYSDAVQHLGEAVQAVLQFHGRQRHELPEPVARALYLIVAATEHIQRERQTALRAQYVEAVDELRSFLRFVADDEGTFHVIFHDAKTHPLDVVRDLSYCGITGAENFTERYAALPPSAYGQPLCPECAVKSITHLYGPNVVAEGTDRTWAVIPPVTAEELAENESAVVTESRCPGPPHPGHASSDWTCSYDRREPS